MRVLPARLASQLLGKGTKRSVSPRDVQPHYGHKALVKMAKRVIGIRLVMCDAEDVLP